MYRLFRKRYMGECGGQSVRKWTPLELMWADHNILYCYQICLACSRPTIDVNLNSATLAIMMCGIKHWLNVFSTFATAINIGGAPTTANTRHYPTFDFCCFAVCPTLLVIQWTSLVFLDYPVSIYKGFYVTGPRSSPADTARTLNQCWFNVGPE